VVVEEAAHVLARRRRLVAREDREQDLLLLAEVVEDVLVPGHDEGARRLLDRPGVGLAGRRAPERAGVDEGQQVVAREIVQGDVSLHGRPPPT